MFRRKRRQAAQQQGVRPRAVSPAPSTRTVVTDTTTVYDDYGYGGGFYGTDPVTALVEAEIVEDVLLNDGVGYGGDLIVDDFNTTGVVDDSSWGGVDDFSGADGDFGGGYDTGGDFGGGGDFDSGSGGDW